MNNSRLKKNALVATIAALFICVHALAGFGEPPVDIRPGSHDLGNRQASFALWAPGKQSVSLIGDFNDWDEEKNPMKLASCGTWWTILELWPGEYRYKFSVDGKHIGDPYATNVDWGYFGPNAILEMNARPFPWTNNNWRTPPLNDLVIYEVHVGDFSRTKDFQGVIRGLDYIQSLGVNAIKLMPIMEFPGDVSWGYNTAFHLAPESAYGEPEDLKQLVNEAHRRGIAVILDIVLNHISHDHPLNQLYDYHSNPYMSTDQNEWGFPDLNLWHPATKQYVRAALEHWMKEYRVDGFRYDYTIGIGYDGFDGVSYISWAARQIKRDVIQIAEHLPEDPHMIQVTEMDSCWHANFHHQMKANLREGIYKNNYHWRDLDRTARVLHYARSGYTDNAQVINYIESHDEERIIREAMSNPNINRVSAVEKSKLGLTVLMTASGVPMLYHGQEIGMDTARTIDPNPVQWNLANSCPGDHLLPFYRKMIRLRRENRALRENGIEIMRKYHDRNVIIYRRWDHHGNVIVVAANFDKFAQHVDIPFPYNGRWYEYVYEYDMHVHNNMLQNHEIPGSAAKVFILQN